MTSASRTSSRAHEPALKTYRKGPRQAREDGHMPFSPYLFPTPHSWSFKTGESSNCLVDDSMPEPLSYAEGVVLYVCSDDPCYRLFLPTTSVNPSSSTLGWTFSLGTFTIEGASSISTSSSASSSSISSLSQSVSSSSSFLVTC